MKQLEEALEAEPSTDEEEQLAWERVRDEATRWLVARQRGRVEESEEEEEEEDEDELEGLSGLSAKAREKCPTKYRRHHVSTPRTVVYKFRDYCCA